MVPELCFDSGWRDDRGEPIDYYAVTELVWPTLAALLGARWNAGVAWPSWVAAAAASVLFADGSG